jgi:excisionase family DNA binding protein
MTQGNDPSNPLDKMLLTADEAFTLLRVDRTTGYKAIREGRFPLPILRVGRLIRVPTHQMLKLLEADDKPAASEERPGTNAH